jgi:hypothetical protein
MIEDSHFINFDFVKYGEDNPDYKFACHIFNMETGNAYTIFLN